MTVILAFDLATKTGVAAGDAGEAPTCSTVTLAPPRSTHATLCAAAARMTQRLIKEYEPDILAIEAPFLNMKHPAAAALLYSIRGAVFAIAKINDLNPLEYSPGKIRSHFISTGSLGRAEAKASVMDVCRMLGWQVANNDEADAAAVFEMARADAKLSSMMPARGLFGTARIKGE